MTSPATKQVRPPSQVVAFSGGKDSTAMALRMAELGEPFRLLFTPTGNELPELEAHMARVVEATGAELLVPPNQTLGWWIERQQMLPSQRARWCTRLIKLRPCIDWLKANPGTTLCVGLRADEEERTGLYGEFATYRYPLREWGWGLAEVTRYVRERGFRPPKRTDCAVCPFQRLGEWFDLWREHPEKWAEGEKWEADIGHTFRSSQRDSWPASMAGLRAEFERGRVPPGASVNEELFDGEGACRVCRF